MKIQRLTYASVLGWVVGLAIVGSMIAGVGFSDLAGIGSRGADAADELSPRHLTKDEALAKAAEWARPYVQDTIGRDQQTGVSISLDDMELVEARFLPDAREIVTSVTTAVSLPAAQDVWVFAWELGGVANVTTGKRDGTAHLVLVMEDGTGKVRDAAAGVRQPEDQVRQCGPWPSFDELLGNAMRHFEQQQAQCGAGARQSPGTVTAITC